MKKQKPKQFICPKCGNQRTESNCDYCNWKGDEGPGAQLKSLVKQYNLKQSEVNH